MGGLLPEAFRVGIAVAGLSLLVAREASLVRFPIPQRRWQVPRSAVSSSPTAMSLVWGVSLGAGIVTYVTFGILWGMHLLLFAIASPYYGAIGGAVYGLSRAAPSLFIANSRHLQEQWLIPSPVRLFAKGPAVARAGAVAMALALAILLGELY